MKKAIVALAIAAFASNAFAVIAGGSHDLTRLAGAQLSSCQFCHTPHGANNTTGTSTNVQYDYSLHPLWNRMQPTATYTFYTSVVDQTITVGAGSFACLSCHDGASDMGQTFKGTRGFAATTRMAAGSFANLTTTLTNDHPVGVTFVPGGTYNTIAAVTQAGLKLYTANNVECGSCHDPHGASDGATGSGPTGLASFLRVSSTTICTVCHSGK